ncbi:hypothetical protein SUG92_02735 [Streptococcus agalactiae]|uniref:hypothetical protein n=1 Tax=Streptococcus agalactiae TaxID=1311 RepID=UPI000F5D0DB8|nr:hypothetical protein [Streptococcus agalactiae]KAF1268411.1 hypothetical protein B8V77_04315 [Streptococcus agalactiae]MCD0151476.1 hypothetical protein [Streptococcus agalactiae]RRA51983.1 hypothetical protein D5F80_10500 [Streptococcus agalactiae]
MTSLINVIKEMNLPYAYHHFAESNAVSPPFLIYLLPSTNHFKADGKIHHKISVVHLELYTDKKDITLESRLESILDKYEIVYDKHETWIESEKLYEVLYTFEMEEQKLWQTKSNII